MSQHITASFHYEDYMVGKWPVELGGVTDTQVQWITRLLPADIVLNTGLCADRRHLFARTSLRVQA